MAAKITQIIGAQSYEVIRDQIALILGLELPNQVLLSGDYELEAIVYVERNVPPNSSELDGECLVNVLLGGGTYGNQDVSQTNGRYQYFIDVYAAAKSTATVNGDTRAMLITQKLLGKCRAILEAGQYITLGFQPPFVIGRKVTSIQIPQPDGAGADNIFRTRLVLEVEVPEFQQAVEPVLIDGNDTTVFMGISSEGYFWVNTTP